MRLADSTVAAMDIMQDTEYTHQLSPTLDGGDILDGLTRFFDMYEVPVGLVNKLLALQFFNLHFIVDDSGSMKAPCDVHVTEGVPEMLRGYAPRPNEFMTRWQEAENRLHIMMDILAFIPTKNILITFMNAPNVIQLSRQSKSPDVFRQESHGAIAHAFTTIPVKYQTPTYHALSTSFNHASTLPDPTMHYLLTDGVPSDRPKEAIAELILRRPNPDRHPVTLCSCSNEDSEVEWMKDVGTDTKLISYICIYIIYIYIGYMDKYNPLFRHISLS